MSDTSMLILGGSKRGRGRPALQRQPSEELTPLSTRVTVRDYDNIIQLANASRMSVSQFVRTVLSQRATAK